MRRASEGKVMLSIFKGRENIDKEKFVFDHLSGESLVIVPDQYTYIAENQALRYLGTDCLLDVEIISMNRLGLRMLQEQGIENLPTLDRRERYMLLARSVRRNRDQLKLFRKAADKRGFVSMISDFIADLKQQNGTFRDLEEMEESPDADPVLRMKLKEILLIASDYQASIEGKYADTDDYINKYIEAIGRSESIRNKEIWVYGFDSMTPKFIDALTEAAQVARNVSVMVNVSDFGMDRIVSHALTEASERKGIRTEVRELGAGTAEKLSKSRTIAEIEQCLFAPPGSGVSEAPAIDTEELRRDLRLVECANPYAEAENAAIYIRQLLREGYAMNEIAIVANDRDQFQPIVKRTFDEYELPLFLDARRSVRDSQAVRFIMSLLDILQNGYRTEPVMTMLKSGLSGVPKPDIWELENYVKTYRIRSRKWTQPFKYGEFELGPETMAMLEARRAEIVGKVEKLREIADNSVSVMDFIVQFYGYLTEVWDLKTRVAEISNALQEEKRFEDAEWTEQSYNAVIRMLDSVGSIVGDEPLDLHEFCELYEEGILSEEVGLIPPTKDGLTIGTMIRSRTNPPKVMLVLGANEGVLPLEPDTSGLFSLEEKAWFSGKDFPLGRLDELKRLEENTAMYRTVSKPSDRLYVSYSIADTEGGEMRPSVLVDTLKEQFPTLKIERDAASGGFDMDVVQSGRPALRHMINHYKERPADEMSALLPEGEAADPLAADYIADGMAAWYEKHDPELFRQIVSAACDENRAQPLPEDLVRRIYTGREGTVRLSPSKLERYEHCPFRFYVEHGLRLKEQREYICSGREFGDVIHEILMSSVEDMKKEGRFDQETAAAAAGQEADRIAEIYRGGFFRSSAQEEYHMENIRRLGIEAASAVAEQLRNANLTDVFCEQAFSSGGTLKPIRFRTPEGLEIEVAGKIDRIDLLADGKSVRVVDYKTGNDQANIEYMRNGHKMQLMVYLKCLTDQGYEPAGVFYVNVREWVTDAKGKSEETLQSAMEKDARDQFLLKGVYIQDAELVDAMAKDSLGRGQALSREDFSQLQQDVDDSIHRLGEEISRGEIEKEPYMILGKESACTYCEYKALCRFDTSFKGNKYRLE